MSRFIAEKYASLAAYTPGEQPRDTEYVKLNTNESPFPPAPGVIRAVSGEAEKLNLYPDPECGRLREKIAEVYGEKYGGGLAPENIFAANGSDDILNFAFMAFCGRGTVSFPDITYGFYRVYANLHGLDFCEKPLRSDFSVRTEDYLSDTGCVVLANPNAPTGIALPLSEIEKIAAANPNHLVIIDEAYVDFGAESAISLCKKYENLLVVFTFSKSRSLAGARLGFAVGHPAVIADLEKIKYSTNPYNVNRLTALCGAASLDDADYFEKNCREIMRVRERARADLARRGFTLTDSKANFLFAKHGRISGRDFYLRLRKKGVLVRNFSGERIGDYNRITVGSAAQMDALVAAVDEILTEEKNNAQGGN